MRGKVHYSIFPILIIAFSNLCLVYLKLGQYDTSISISLHILTAKSDDKHIESLPTNNLKASAAYNIGKAFEAKGNLKDAYHYYQKSYNLDPNSVRFKAVKRIERKIQK